MVSNNMKFALMNVTKNDYVFVSVIEVKYSCIVFLIVMCGTYIYETFQHKTH